VHVKNENLELSIKEMNIPFLSSLFILRFITDIRIMQDLCHAFGTYFLEVSFTNFILLTNLFSKYACQLIQ